MGGGAGGIGRWKWTTSKRMVWTVAFAAVTIVGSIYGAGLKTQQEYHHVWFPSIIIINKHSCMHTCSL
jgi:hypothetical protein